MAKSGKVKKKQDKDASSGWVELAAYISVAALIFLTIIHGQQIRNLQDQIDVLEMEQTL